MRIGLNIHPTVNGQPYSAQDKIYLTEFLRQLRPDAIVVMDTFESALAYKIMLPDTNVIYRKYSAWEGNLWDWPPGADMWWYNMQDSRDPRLTLYVTNESHGAAAPEDIPVMKKAVAWWVRVMELASKDGIRLCLPNWGTGNPHMSWFQDDKLWAVVEPLFKAFKKYPQHYFGLHHYYWKKIEPGDGNVDRHRDIRAALSARGYNDLQYVLTEVGSDDVFLKNQRGWQNTLTEPEYIQTLATAKRTAWNDPHIKGATIFCWGGSGEWPSFNIMHAKDLHKALITMNNEPVVLPPAPAVRWIASTSRLKLGVEHANLREAPDLSSRDLGDIHGGDPIFYDSTGLLHDWWHVKFYETEGYVNNLYFEPLVGELPGGHDEPPTTIPPIIVVPPAPLNAYQRIAAHLRAIADELDKLALAA